MLAYENVNRHKWEAILFIRYLFKWNPTALIHHNVIPLFRFITDWRCVIPLEIPSFNYKKSFIFGINKDTKLYVCDFS